jgi:hypothetical protein
MIWMFPDRARTGSTAPRQARANARPEDERLVVMSEFQQEIQVRMELASASLAEAQQEGDDYLAQVRLGELESLQRLAAEHTVA